MPCRTGFEEPTPYEECSSERYKLQKQVEELETELCMLREYLLNSQKFESYKEKIIRDSQLYHRREDVEIRIQRELEKINSRLKSKQMYKGTEFESLFGNTLDKDIKKSEQIIFFLRNLKEEQLLNRVYLNDEYIL